VVLKDFDTSPVPRALITGLRGTTCSRVMPTAVHPYFFFWGIYLGNNPQEEAAMKGLLGADRLIACLPGELHLKFSNVLRTFRPVGVYQGDKGKEHRISCAPFCRDTKNLASSEGATAPSDGLLSLSRAVLTRAYVVYFSTER